MRGSARRSVIKLGREGQNWVEKNQDLSLLPWLLAGFFLAYATWDCLVLADSLLLDLVEAIGVGDFFIEADDYGIRIDRGLLLGPSLFAQFFSAALLFCWRSRASFFIALLVNLPFVLAGAIELAIAGLGVLAFLWLLLVAEGMKYLSNFAEFFAVYSAYALLYFFYVFTFIAHYRAFLRAGGKSSFFSEALDK